MKKKIIELNFYLEMKYFIELYSFIKEDFIEVFKSVKNKYDKSNLYLKNCIDYMDSLSNTYKQINNFNLSSKFATKVMEINDANIVVSLNLLFFLHNLFNVYIDYQNKEVEKIDMFIGKFALVESFFESIKRQNTLLKEYLDFGE